MTSIGMRAALLGIAAMGVTPTSFGPSDGWDIAPARPTKHRAAIKDRAKVKAARKASRMSRRKRK